MFKSVNSKSAVCLVWLCLFVSALLTIYFSMIGLVVGGGVLLLLSLICLHPKSGSDFKPVYLNQLSSLVVYLLFNLGGIVLVRFDMILLGALFLLCIRIMYLIYCFIVLVQALFSSESDLLSREGGF